MSGIAVYFRFSHLTLLSIKNYEYFCVQNYELELRLFHNDADYGGARGVLLSVGIGKNRQQLKILNASQKSKIQFPRLSVNFHKSTRLVPTPLQTPLKITEFAQIRKNV